MTAFFENVNAASVAISKLTPDPAERLGIVFVLTEMYRYEVGQSFVPLNKDQK